MFSAPFVHHHKLVPSVLLLFFEIDCRFDNIYKLKELNTLFYLDINEFFKYHLVDQLPIALVLTRDELELSGVLG